MNALREAFVGIISALAVSLLVVGALALAITEGMVVPEASSDPNPAPTTPALTTDASLVFPELSTATRRPTARLVAATTQPAVTKCPVVPGWERYVTAPGDTLEALAAARGASVEQLIEANCLSGVSLIAGSQLYLPRPTETPTLPALTATLTTTSSPTAVLCGPPPGWVKYTVRSGDTLNRLRLIYRVSVADLQFANCMGTSSRLTTGDILFVPNVTPNYTATPTPTSTPVLPTPVPPTATVTPTMMATTPVPSPALSLSKTANLTTYESLNQAITYTYILRNTGNVPLDGPFAVSDDKTTVTCPGTPATLAHNATLACSATYRVVQADLDSGSLTNQSTATARYRGQAISSNKATLRLLASQRPELALANKASPDTYNAKDQVVTFSITVLNSGNVTLTAPTVSADPDAAACPSAPASLAPGAAFTCSASHKVTQADLDARSISNTANASMKFGNLAVPAKPATARSTAVLNAALDLTKAGTLPASPITAGKVIHYSYTLRNTGNVTLSRPITVTDDKTTVTCPGTPASLAPGDSLVCTADYTITPADITAGSVTNRATAHAGTVNSSQKTVTLTFPAGTPDR